MIRSSFKVYLLTAGLLGLAFLPSQEAHAQTTINATLSVSNAITGTAGNALDFGTWVLGHDGSDNFDLVKDTTAGPATVSGLTTSAAVEITPSAGPGTATVTTAVGVDNYNISMNLDSITDFADAALTLTNITYLTDSSAEAALAINTPVSVNVTTGGANETVTFGGTVQVTAEPTDGAKTASFDVSFSY
jgi:hypothetical protein